MLVPSIFGESFFDDFDRMFLCPDVQERKPKVSPRDMGLMKTDIRETEEGFEIEMDLPGYAKDEVSAEIKDGYLVISAEKSSEEDEKDKKGNYIRRERYFGSMSRSFFVGKHLHEDDIKASFKDGTLRISVPKEQPQAIEDQRHIVNIA